jgi:EAL domain-containing protein (putative c-di-GMP-specific phosphodiesterase class I)
VYMVVIHAEGLPMDFIAEGIETREQLALLVGLGREFD